MYEACGFCRARTLTFITSILPGAVCIGNSDHDTVVEIGSEGEHLAWRKTPGFRHWRKCCQPSLVRGWRKRYRLFSSPAAYSQLQARAGLRYRQTELPREPERTGCQQLVTVGHCEWIDRGVIVKLSLFLGILGPWPTPPEDLRPQRQRWRLLQLVRYGNHGEGLQPLLQQPAQEDSSKTRDTSAAARTGGRQVIRSTAPVPVVQS